MFMFISGFISGSGCIYGKYAVIVQYGVDIQDGFIHSDSILAVMLQLLKHISIRKLPFAFLNGMAITGPSDICLTSCPLPVIIVGIAPS